MSQVLKFTENTITDGKRLARGEHYLMARKILRARDHVHNGKWHVMMMAGGSPRGEIKAINEIFPNSYIVAVDKDQQCLEIANEAGANETIQCDLTDFYVHKIPEHPDYIFRKQVNERLLDTYNFDILNLDMCGGINSTSRDLIKIYKNKLSIGGVMMFTFSYGRDVVEVFQDAMEKFVDPINEIFPSDMVENSDYHHLIGRLIFLLGSPVNGHKIKSSISLESLRSIIIYQGNKMPMCSLLFGSRRKTIIKDGELRQPISFLRIGPGDFEIAVTCPSSENLYDCPQDRIESLRRKHAAIKASYTRSNKRRAPC